MGLSLQYTLERASDLLIVSHIITLALEVIQQHICNVVDARNRRVLIVFRVPAERIDPRRGHDIW